MKLSEKIQYLRRKKGCSQEELAQVCSVSRQSVSKWEADMALPELEKLLILSDFFGVSTDVLLREACELPGGKEVHSCGANALRRQKEQMMEMSVYEGILIKESLVDDRVMDYLEIHKVELWNTGGDAAPRYWTAVFFTSRLPDLPERFAKVMRGAAEESAAPGNVRTPEKASDRGMDPTEENWFVDFKRGNQKYIVFRNRILKYTIGNQQERASVCEACRQLGITDAEMNWGE